MLLTCKLQVCFIFPIGAPERIYGHFMAFMGTSLLL